MFILATQLPSDWKLKDGINWSTFSSNMLALGIFAAIIGIPLVLLTVKAADRNARSRIFLGAVLAVLAGFISPTVWLSWSKTTGIADVFFKYGIPYDPAIWQMVACGVMVIGLSGLIVYKFADSFAWIPMVAFFTAFGFATAFTAAFSYDVPSQEGIGIFMAFTGVGIVTFLTNLLFGVKTLKSRPLSLDGKRLEKLFIDRDSPWVTGICYVIIVYGLLTYPIMQLALAFLPEDLAEPLSWVILGPTYLPLGLIVAGLSAWKRLWGLTVYGLLWSIISLVLPFLISTIIGSEV